MAIDLLATNANAIPHRHLLTCNSVRAAQLRFQFCQPQLEAHTLRIGVVDE